MGERPLLRYEKDEDGQPIALHVGNCPAPDGGECDCDDQQFAGAPTGREGEPVVVTCPHCDGLGVARQRPADPRSVVSPTLVENENPQPCPFCGGDDIYVEPDERGSGGQHVLPYHIGCPRCALDMTALSADTEAEAVALWNRRAAAARIRELERALDNVRWITDGDCNRESWTNANDIAKRVLASHTESEDRRG